MLAPSPGVPGPSKCAFYARRMARSPHPLGGAGSCRTEGSGPSLNSHQLRVGKQSVANRMVSLACRRSCGR